MASAMDSSPPPVQQPGGIRRRATLETISKSTTEDQALNEIAKEAEVRLAAKRAARAEARSIRMKEIEREQKEGGDDDEDLVEEEEEQPKEKKILTRGNTMRERASVTRLSIDDSASGENEVIELKALIKVEEAKYKKAMVNNAQLDNERQALQYQVEMLRDAIEELQENLTNKEDELHHKSRDYSKLSREHQNTCADLSKSLHIITERERVLDEHGINIDGSIKEGYSPPSSASGLCSSCGGTLGDDGENGMGNQSERSLLAEISSLRNELYELRLADRSERSINVLESIQTEQSELDQSFADVSNEAAVIRDDALHTGLYVNNNEKNDDFEMIDNGVQQDGMRHFEDQSYEKSSSLTSSMMTDTATSIESSLPLEINVDDSHGKGRLEVAKDDYDIVQVGDDSKSSKPIDINVHGYTNVDFGPSVSSSSGSITSSINVNKYLFDDQDETATEDAEEFSVFSVNRYFAAESPEHSAAGANSGSNSQRSEDNHEFQTSVDTITNVQSDYDTIDTEDVYQNAENRFVCEENHDSPYEDVQEESVQLGKMTTDHNMVIIDDETASLEKSSSLQVSDQSKSDEPEPANNVDVSGMTILQTHVDTDFTSPSPEPLSRTVEVISPTGLPTTAEGVQSPESTMSEEEIAVTDLDTVAADKTTELSDTVVEDSASLMVNGNIEETPASPSVTAGNSVTTKDVEPIKEEQETIRHDVEDLYNQIAKETKEDIELEEESQPTVTWEVECATSANGPEINIVDTEPAVRVENETALPKAKERKSKKKKKKGDKVTTVEMVDNHDPALGSVVLTDPLLLGFTEPDRAGQHPEEESEKTVQKPSDRASRKSDIPKQFLDASADLIGTSGSDLSDVEEGYLSDDGEGEGKRKSSKRSKKDGCKSQ